jgi:hypothetical protein
VVRLLVDPLRVLGLPSLYFVTGKARESEQDSGMITGEIRDVLVKVDVYDEVVDESFCLGSGPIE